jgi:hypothetical protein
MKIYLVLGLMMASQMARATLCESDMKKFDKISTAKRSYVCRDLKSDAMYSDFKECVISTAKRFDKSLTEEKLRQIDEKQLSGIFDLCSGGMTSAQPSRPGTQ